MQGTTRKLRGVAHAQLYGDVVRSVRRCAAKVQDAMGSDEMRASELDKLIVVSIGRVTFNVSARFGRTAGRPRRAAVCSRTCR